MAHDDRYPSARGQEEICPCSVAGEHMNTDCDRAQSRRFRLAARQLIEGGRMNETVEQLLEKFDDAYGGDVHEYLGEEWRDILRPLLEAAWQAGKVDAI